MSGSSCKFLVAVLAVLASGLRRAIFVGGCFGIFCHCRNFLLGSRDYENTCFIAATLNLGSWVPDIERALLGEGTFCMMRSLAM